MDKNFQIQIILTRLLPFLSVYLTLQFGSNSAEVGLVLVMLSLGYSVFSPVVGYLMDKVSFIPL